MNCFFYSNLAVNNLLDTSTASLSDIIANGKIYKAPSYQRDYSWKLDNWEDLEQFQHLYLFIRFRIK